METTLAAGIDTAAFPMVLVYESYRRHTVALSADGRPADDGRREGRQPDQRKHLLRVEVQRRQPTGPLAGPARWGNRTGRVQRRACGDRA